MSRRKVKKLSEQLNKCKQKISNLEVELWNEKRIKYPVAFRYEIGRSFAYNENLQITFQIDKFTLQDMMKQNLFEEECKNQMRRLLEEAYKKWGIK